MKISKKGELPIANEEGGRGGVNVFNTV